MDKASIPNELILESPLLKLPHELLRTNLKAQQKLVEKEISMCLAAAGQMEFSYSQDDNSFKISDMIERLKLLRRKVCDSADLMSFSALICSDLDLSE